MYSVIFNLYYYILFSIYVTNKIKKPNNKTHKKIKKAKNSCV